MSLTCFMLHRFLDRGKPTFELSVARVMLQTLLIGIVRTDKIALAMKGGTFPAPALGPVRLELRRLLSILQSTVPFLLGSVRS